MRPSNFHSHCNFCDGRSFPENFVKFAWEKGFRAYGFSSHSPLPFETFWNMSSSDMDEYLAEINRLKTKYQDRIEIYTGLEIDFLDKSYNPSIDYFQQIKLDYRIASIHFLPHSETLAEENMMCIDGSFSDFEHNVDTIYGKDIRNLVKHYFRSAAEMVEAGGFDIIGHIDKVYMNGQRYPGFSLEAPWYRKAMLELLDLIAEKGFIIEINAKNYQRKKETYPHISYWEEIRKRNIPIQVNSDCHFPDLVNDGRNETLQLLKEQGFRCTRELAGGKWEEFEI